MSESKGVFENLLARGERIWGRLWSELMADPRFVRALEGAARGKQTLDRAVGRALRTMNIPTRTEFKRLLGRVEALEAELSALKAKPKPRAQRRRGGRKRGAAPPAKASRLRSVAVLAPPAGDEPQEP